MVVVSYSLVHGHGRARRRGRASLNMFEGVRGGGIFLERLGHCSGCENGRWHMHEPFHVISCRIGHTLHAIFLHCSGLMISSLS